MAPNLIVDAKKQPLFIVTDQNGNIVQTIIANPTQIGLENIKSELTVYGRLALSERRVSLETVKTATLNASDIFASCISDGSAGLATIILPGNPRNGQLHVIKDLTGTASVETIVITTSDGSTIDGAVSQSITSAFGSLCVYWDADQWLTFASNGTGGGGGAPTTAQYVTLAYDGSLSQERVLTQGTGIKVVDGGANNPVTLSINDSIVATVSGSTFTGAVKFNAGLSGSLTQLTNGTSYLREGRLIKIVTGSAGQVTISEDYLPSSEPVGFENRSSSSISFNAGTLNFSISPKAPATEFNVWEPPGIKYVHTSTETIPITNSPGVHFIVYENGSLVEYLGFPGSFNHALVSAIYWNSTASLAVGVQDERHGVVMDWSTHEYLHQTIGTRYSSGLTLTRSSTGTGAADIDAILQLTGGTIYDEDIKLSIVRSTSPVNDFEQELGLYNSLSPPLSIPAKLPILYRSGTNGEWTKFSTTEYIVKQSGAVSSSTRVMYNTNPGTGWDSIQATTNGNRLASWIFATNSITEPVVAIMGQREDTTLTNAQNNNKYESLTFGTLPFQEMKVLYRVIFRTSTAYANNINAYIEDVQDLRSVSNVPAGTYVATSHSSLTGLTNANSHPATAISTDTTNFNKILSTVETDVQLALDKIDNNTALITGDTFTGVVNFNAGLSGSLTRLTDNTPYIRAGSNITINSSSYGWIEITGSAGGGPTSASFYYVTGSAETSWWYAATDFAQNTVASITTAAGSYSGGCRFYVHRPVYVTGAKFFAKSLSGKTVRVSLWDGAGTRLTYVDVPVTTDGIYVAKFASAITLAASIGVANPYTVSSWVTDGSYYITTTSAALNEVTRQNGPAASIPDYAWSYWGGGDSFPNSTAASENYLVDPMITEITASMNAIAVHSLPILSSVAITNFTSASKLSIGSCYFDPILISKFTGTKTYKFKALLDSLDTNISASIDLYSVTSIFGSPAAPGIISGSIMSSSNTTTTYIASDLTTQLSGVNSPCIFEARLWMVSPTTASYVTCRNAQLDIELS